MKLSKKMNGWLVVLVVLVTAGITSWVMLKDKPRQTWNPAYYYSPQQVAWNFSPGITAVSICTDCHPGISTIANVTSPSTLPHDHRGICTNCHRLSGQDKGVLQYVPTPDLTQSINPMASVWWQVAGTDGIPVIRAGAVPPHADRGVCSNCHRVVDSQGNPIPNISTTSTSPHVSRGICSNCHLVGAQYAALLPTNMGGMQAPYRYFMEPAAIPMAPPLRTATEGEWMGLEVAPITPLTAGQYGIPDGTRGLVVAEAEGQAATAGLNAGDVLLSVNGALISNMTDFFQATRNGTLTQGMVEVLRGGQKLAVYIWGDGTGMGDVQKGGPGAGSPKQF